MNFVPDHLWLIPALPLLAAAVTAVCRRERRAMAAELAIGSMALALGLSVVAFLKTVAPVADREVFREVRNFDWFQLGDSAVRLGWVLDPLSAAMLVMVTLVGLLIFIYSVGYMAHDENLTRFFCFLSLFAAAMLGLVLANSLLLLFICWELVGLTSYLLIGFWFHKPGAAAAAKKAFLVTRIGDLALFLGLLWLYRETGTLLFYDGGNGCLEQSALAKLVTQTLSCGMAASTAIGLLIFGGAIGKSGQLPLHVWLPDAMEGPTPVSALIHAATMVAAGVFLVARVYPLMAVVPGDPVAGEVPGLTSSSLQVVTWIGALTAVFAALIAVAQTDIKRILAYSTVSQLGYMMLGLGVGGVAIGMFHLLTHAFFKALLFLGAGSVIHGSHDEQDIRRMGGLRRFMPVTFATYAIGMLALAGVVPLAGFWSKDGILHAAHGGSGSHGPFYLGLFGALVTAFYMTRQVCLVFLGTRGAECGVRNEHRTEPPPHESPRVMTVPLIVLAVFAALLGFLGTPVWPWLQDYLGAGHAEITLGQVIPMMLVSTIVAAAGIGLGWLLYGRTPLRRVEAPDPLERISVSGFRVLRERFFVDEVYEATVARWTTQFCRFCHALDAMVLEGLVTLTAYLVLGVSWLARLVDEYAVNRGFDRGCERLRTGGGFLSRLQDGQIQNYLRALGLSLTVFLLLLLWGCR